MAFLGMFLQLLGTATVWDSVTTFISDNTPLLVSALLAIFAIPVAFAIFRLCKNALNKAA